MKVMGGRAAPRGHAGRAMFARKKVLGVLVIGAAGVMVAACIQEEDRGNTGSPMGWSALTNWYSVRRCPGLMGWRMGP